MVLLTTILMSLILMAANAAGDYSCSTAANFDRHMNKRLRCGIFKTLTIDHDDCQKLCAATLTCFSTNSYRNDKGNETCELIRGTRKSFNNDGCFERKDGGVYTELLASTFNDTVRKALPDGWFQLDSSAFKFFNTSTDLEAKATCDANGATKLNKLFNQQNLKFVAGVFPEGMVDPYLKVQEMRPTKLWKLDGSDSDVGIFGNVSYQEDDETFTAVLDLPGTAGSYATTPKFPISQTNSTLSFWIKSPNIAQFVATDTSPQVYSSWHGTPGTSHVFAITPSMFTARRVYHQKTTRFKVVHNTILEDNKWIHVVGVWNRYAFGEGIASMYINGEKVKEQLVKDTNKNGIGFPNPPGNVFDIGYNRETAAVMKGRIRDVVVFDRPLSDEEVKQLKEALDPDKLLAIRLGFCKKKV